MCRTRWTIDDFPRNVGWNHLAAFLKYEQANPDSALCMDTDPEQARWAGTRNLAMLLAGACDLLSVIDWHYVTAHLSDNAHKPRAPRPIPRPGVDDGVERIGRGCAVSVDELDRQLAARAAMHANRNDD